MFNKNSVLFRSIVYVLMVVLAYGDLLVYADTVSSTGRQGQEFGMELLNTWKDNQATSSENQLTIPGTSEPIAISDLFPGTSATGSTSGVRYFPDGYNTDSTGYESIHDSGAAQDNQGNAAQANLWDDAHADDPTIQGQVYKILLDMTNRSRPDFKNDPILQKTRTTMGDIGTLVSDFGDCSQVTTYSREGVPVHVSEYEQCERLYKPEGGNCTIKHEIQVETHSFDVKLAAPGRDYITIRFDLTNGSWTHISPTDGDERTVQIPTLNYNTICGGDRIASRTVLKNAWEWSGHGFPGVVDSSVNYNVLQYPACNNNLVGIVQIEDTTISDETDYVLGGQFSMTIEHLTVDEWSPASCVEDLKHTDDGFCEAEVVETIGPTVQGEECLMVGTTQICPGDALYNAMQPAPTQKLSKLTLEATMSELVCNYNVGQMDCYTDVNGVLQCPYNDGPLLTTCDALESNPQCGFIRTTCVDGARGSVSGECYIFEDIYDCGYDTEYGTLTSTTELVCEGPIRCLGLDCIDVNRTQNNQFAKSAALLNAAQAMSSDLTCTGLEEGEIPDGTDNGLCDVFTGEAGECKKAMGGIVNCCEKPGGISVADYLSLIMATPKLDDALTWLGKEGWSLGSSYVAVKEGVVEGFQQISQPFTGAFDSISGSYDVAKEAVSEVIQGIKDKFADMFSTALEAIGFGGEAGSATAGAITSTADTGANAAADAFMQQAGSMLQFISTVYTIYSVTMLAIKMIFKCTEDELKLNVNRTLHNCTYLGSYCKTEVLGQCIEKRESYCCFSSPLSRIIQEQARPQLGRSFGSPKNPECEGLGMSEIAAIDWERIDLSEWLGLLSSNGLWTLDNEITIPHLTGAGTTLDLGSRVDAEVRTMERLSGADIDQTRVDVSREYKPYTGAPGTP